MLKQVRMMRERTWPVCVFRWRNRATGRKLCGAPDEAAEDDCVDRLAECEALERAGCEAGEKLGIDGEPDFGGTGDL